MNFSSRTFLYKRVGDEWQGYSFAQVWQQTCDLAGYLSVLGRGRVIIVTENIPEFFIAVYACALSGSIAVPITPQINNEHFQYIVDLCEPMLIIASKAEYLTRFQQVNRAIVIGEDNYQKAHAQYKDSEIYEFNRIPNQEFSPAEALQSLNKRDDFVLIWTSGTSGLPKGVRLNHHNINHNIRGVAPIFDHLPDYKYGEEVFLSFLPTSHIYEFMVIGGVSLNLGAQVYFCDSNDRIMSYMGEVKPTIMTAVPRLYEVLRTKILMGTRNANFVKKFLFRLTVQLGQKQIKGALPFPLNLVNQLCSLLVRKTVRARFGGRLKTFVSGGGPLNPDVGGFIVALGLPILQGYGLSETSPVVSVNLPHDWRVHTAGSLLPNTEVKIAIDGEIMVRGDLVMAGYWRDEAATRAVIDQDGWFATGDIGLFDGHHLCITDRKKDIIINRGGEKIAPQRIEAILNFESAISQSFIYGEQQNFCVAVLVPSDEIINLPIDEQKIHLESTVKSVNARLDEHERIARFIIADEPFSQEKGFITHTLKLRRNAVLSHYQERIMKLYSNKPIKL